MCEGITYAVGGTGENLLDALQREAHWINDPSGWIASSCLSRRPLFHGYTSEQIRDTEVACMEIVGSDGLPIDEVGDWAIEKHERLARYVDISKGVRRKFIARGARGATYIELYCGYGRSRIRTSGKEIDGSPIVAAKAARAGGHPFSEIFICDTADERVNACEQRLRACGETRVTTYVGPAESTVTSVVAALDRKALHFAFIDPYSLDLPFTILRDLSTLERMDLLVHLSTQDLQRNLESYLSTGSSTLDRLAPEWRRVVNLLEPQRRIRQAVLNHWLECIRSLNMQPAGIERVVGGNSQELYWLAFAARHPLARKFWDKIRVIGQQPDFLK